MVATVTPSIGSLILSIDDPVRDDLTAVKVWVSTVDGFTPSSSNLVFNGKAFTIVLSNLTPLVTYYIKYAYISEIDVGDYNLSTQLSGVPNKVDGTLLADVLQGKTILTSGAEIVGDTVFSSFTTTHTVELTNVLDFPPVGTAYVVSKNVGTVQVIRYNGIDTNTLSLLNVSGLTSNLYSGSIIIPSITTGVAVNSYSGSGTITDLQCVDGEGSTSYFRSAGGNALLLIGNYFIGGTTGQALSFSYTGSTYSTSASGRSITGISGLSSWTQSDNPQHYILDDFGYPTITLASSFTGTQLSVGTNSYIEKYGRVMFIRLGVTSNIYVYEYSSYTSGNLNFLTPITLSSGSYVLIPLDTISSIGANGIISVSNMDDLGITRQRTINNIQAKKLVVTNKTRDDLSGTVKAIAGRHSIPLRLENETNDSNLAQPVVSSTSFINTGSTAPTNSWSPGDFGIQQLSPVSYPSIVLPELDANTFFRIGDIDITTSTSRNRYVIPCGPVVYFSSEPMYEDGPRIKYDDVTGYSFYSTSTTEAKLANVSVYGLTTVRGLNMTPTSIVPTSGGSTSLTTAANTILFRHSSTIASYTLTLPSGSAANHGMTITLGTRSAITSLTVNAAAADNGVTPVIYGNITTLPVSGFATFTFLYSTTPQWIRTG